MTRPEPPDGGAPLQARIEIGGAPAQAFRRQFAAELMAAADEIARRLREQVQAGTAEPAARQAVRDILDIKREVYRLAARIVEGGSADGGQRSERIRPRRSAPPSRWTAQRKASLVIEVRMGELAVEDACAHYGVTLQELAAWSDAFESYGLEGLKVTKAKRGRGRD